MHFYCTTDFEEIHCSCGFRGFGQGHRHQKGTLKMSVPFCISIYKILLKPISRHKKRTGNWHDCINYRFFFGADNRIWTGDLILTKDALYRLSYISIFFSPLSETAHISYHRFLKNSIPIWKNFCFGWIIRLILGLSWLFLLSATIYDMIHFGILYRNMIQVIMYVISTG